MESSPVHLLTIDFAQEFDYAVLRTCCVQQIARYISWKGSCPEREEITDKIILARLIGTPDMDFTKCARARDRSADAAFLQEHVLDQLDINNALVFKKVNLCEAMALIEEFKKHEYCGGCKNITHLDKWIVDGKSVLVINVTSD